MDDAERLTPGQINLIAAGLDRMADMMAADGATFEAIPFDARESFLSARGLNSETMNKDRESGIKSFRTMAIGARLYARAMTSFNEAQTAGELNSIADDLTDLYHKLK